MFDGMDGVMMLFRRAYNGALNENYVVRFMDVIMLDDASRLLYCNLMYTLFVFCKEETRKNEGRRLHLVGERSLLDHMDVMPRDRLISYLNSL